MQRSYLFILSLALSLFCTPPTWAAGKVANTSNKVAPITGVSEEKLKYQDSQPDQPNYLDRRHALVGANCMINRLKTVVEVAGGGAHLENLVDKDLTNGATFISGVKADVGYAPAYTIRDLKHIYAKDTKAGFVVTFSKVLDLSLLKGPMKIFFYKNGNQVGAVDVDQKDFSVLTLNIGDISKSPIELTATAPADFDEIGLGSTGLIDATVGGAITVRYAFVGKNGKYYIDSEDVNGIADFKKAVINNYPDTKFDNDELVLGECRGFWDSYPESTGNVINNKANDSDPLNILGVPKPVTISAFGGNETYNLPFKKGMTVGFEISGVDVLKLIAVMKFVEYNMNYNGKNYSWKKLNELNAGFTLLGLKVGGGRQEITTTLDQAQVQDRTAIFGVRYRP